MNGREGRGSGLRLKAWVAQQRTHKDSSGDRKTCTERLARLVSRRLPELGLLANLVEYPAVAKDRRVSACRSAGHAQRSIADAVERMAAAVEAATREHAMLKKPSEILTAA